MSKLSCVMTVRVLGPAAAGALVGAAARGGGAAQAVNTSVVASALSNNCLDGKVFIGCL